MEQGFITIIEKMTSEQGVQVLLGGAWRKYLSDYMGSRYAKETKLFKQILETGCADYIDSADNVFERKQALLERLENDHGLSPKATAEYLDLLGMILKGDMSKCGAQSAPPEAAQKPPAAMAPPPSPPRQTAPLPPKQAAPPQEQAEPDGFVKIPGGTFMMGSPEGYAEYDDEEPQHEVRVSGFYMGRYEVTQGEWENVMGDNPSNFEGTRLPVENVSWYDAVEYCNKRSVKEGLNPAYTIDKTREDPGNENDDEDDEEKWLVTWNRKANGYRLPTEAEWEYACRAGTTTRYYTGTTVDSAAWHKTNSANKTHPVGEKQANAWGLYDMLGNVDEWCWDWHGDYSSKPQTDPAGASSGTDRVSRGGNWTNSADGTCSAGRNDMCPSDRWEFLGFRLARSLV